MENTKNSISRKSLINRINRNSRKTNKGAVITHIKNFELPEYGELIIRYRFSQPTSKHGSDIINDAVKKLSSIIRSSEQKLPAEPFLTTERIINSKGCSRFDKSQV